MAGRNPESARQLGLATDSRSEFGAFTDLAHDTRGSDVKDVHREILLAGENAGAELPLMT